MNILCEDCIITASNFENTSIKYNEDNQQTYFSSDFVYSNSAGTVTANTLIYRFQFWILSENMPAITVGSLKFSLNKNCPSFENIVTRDVCMSVFTTSPEKAKVTYPLTITGVLIAVICIGIIAAVVMAALIIW